MQVCKEQKSIKPNLNVKCKVLRYLAGAENSKDEEEQHVS